MSATVNTTAAPAESARARAFAFVGLGAMFVAGVYGLVFSLLHNQGNESAGIGYLTVFAIVTGAGVFALAVRARRALGGR